MSRGRIPSFSRRAVRSRRMAMPSISISLRRMPRPRSCRRSMSLISVLPSQALRRAGITKIGGTRQLFRTQRTGAPTGGCRLKSRVSVEQRGVRLERTACSGEPPAQPPDGVRTFQGKGRKGILRLKKAPSRRSFVFRKFCGPTTGFLPGGSNDLNQRKNITAFSDHHLAPISLAETVEALVAISQSPDSGMFQMSGARDISSFDAARRLASLTNADPNLIVAVKAAESGVPANEIIHNSTLDRHVSPPSPVGRHVILCLSSTKSFRDRASATNRV